MIWIKNKSITALQHIQITNLNKSKEKKKILSCLISQDKKATFFLKPCGLIYSKKDNSKPWGDFEEDLRALKKISSGK